jgi:hypothetical protein
VRLDPKLQPALTPSSSNYCYGHRVLYVSLSLFVGDTDTPPRRADQWRVETEPPAGSGRFGLLQSALDPGKDELSCGAALSGSGLMDPAVKVARQVD